MAYKPNIDDLRESPSIELAHDLIRKGYQVVANEPNSLEEDIEGIRNVDLNVLLDECEYIVITLAHKEYVVIKEELRNFKSFDCIGLLK